MRVGKGGILHNWALGKLNSIGSWCRKLSDYMGGWCQVFFFWNSPEVKVVFSVLFIHSNLCFWCSKETSFEFPQHMFWLRNRYYDNTLIWRRDANMYFTEAALSDITSVDTSERMKDADVLDIQDSEMDKSNIGTHAL